jgi:hypothetical protein
VSPNEGEASMASRFLVATASRRMKSAMRVYQESSRRWSLADNESTSLFSSIGNAWSGDPFIKSAHDHDEIASKQDERAPQYEGDAIE